MQAEERVRRVVEDTVRNHEIEARRLEARAKQVHLEEVRAVEVVLILEGRGELERVQA